MFNVGVESGQVMFVTIVAGLLVLLKRIKSLNPEPVWELAPYAIGSIAAFWTIERTISFLPVGPS